MLSVNQALEKVLLQVIVSKQTENVVLDEALGRTLAEDQISAVDVPPADNSAMDGYAIHTNDLSSEQATKLVVRQIVTAGKAPQAHQPYTATRIFTGAEIPKGADAVVMQEHATKLDDGQRMCKGVLRSRLGLRSINR